MTRAKSRNVENLSLEAREIVAENMKERVYSTITLLAVLAVLWRGKEPHGTLLAMAEIGGGVVAIWLATLIATRMSYRAVHGKPIGRREYIRTFFTSSGLLAPAIPPLVIIAVGGISGWYDQQSALLASIIVSLLSLFALSFTAGRKIYTSFWRLVLVSLLEMSVGVGVILLKLAVGE